MNASRPRAVGTEALPPVAGRRAEPPPLPEPLRAAWQRWQVGRGWSAIGLLGARLLRSNRYRLTGADWQTLHFRPGEALHQRPGLFLPLLAAPERERRGERARSAAALALAGLAGLARPQRFAELRALHRLDGDRWRRALHALWQRQRSAGQPRQIGLIASASFFSRADRRWLRRLGLRLDRAERAVLERCLGAEVGLLDPARPQRWLRAALHYDPPRRWAGLARWFGRRAEVGFRVAALPPEALRSEPGLNRPGAIGILAARVRDPATWLALCHCRDIPSLIQLWQRDPGLRDQIFPSPAGFYRWLGRLPPSLHVPYFATAPDFFTNRDLLRVFGTLPPASQDALVRHWTARVPGLLTLLNEPERVLGTETPFTRAQLESLPAADRRDRDDLPAMLTPETVWGPYYALLMVHRWLRLGADPGAAVELAARLHRGPIFRQWRRRLADWPALAPLWAEYDALQVLDDFFNQGKNHV